MYDPGQSGLVWTTDGTILTETNGKLARRSGFDNFIRRLMFLLRTEAGEYAYAPRAGLGIPSYRGRVNTADLREEIRNTITNQLVELGIVYPYIPIVTVSSLNRKTLTITIAISGELFTYTSALALNIQDGKLIAIDLDQPTTEDETAPVSNISTAAPIKNKYLSRK